MYSCRIPCPPIAAPGKDLYVQLPAGYEAPQGFVARLALSLYGLRDLAFCFHKTLSDWMLEYGFEPLNADKTIFKYEKSGATILVALYVDNSLCAHNSDDEYSLFIQALMSTLSLFRHSQNV